MRRAFKTMLAVCTVCTFVVQHEAHASIDLPGQYDARAVAIGGTGTSYVENGASVFLNPAALDGIKTFAGTVDLGAFVITPKAPAAGPETSVKADTGVVPLFLLGAGLRVSDRLVLGLGVYPSSGFGATYSNFMGGGDNLKLAVFQVEASPAASFKITDGLSIGLGYRITYTNETMHQPAFPMSPALDVSMSGTNFLGVHAGVYYRPSDDLHLAFTYRSRINSSLSGTTEVMGNKLDSTSAFGSPDRFRLGASYSLLNKQLMLAAEVKYLLYSASNKSIDTTVTTPGGPQTTSQPLDWQNVFAFGLGAEYWAAPIIAVRAGYSLGQSATPDHTANPLTPSPGLQHSVHLGAGVRLPDIDLDLGGFYLFAGKHVAADPTAPAVIPGDYGANAVVVAASATYHM